MKLYKSIFITLVLACCLSNNIVAQDEERGPKTVLSLELEDFILKELTSRLEADPQANSLQEIIAYGVACSLPVESIPQVQYEISAEIITLYIAAIKADYPKELKGLTDERIQTHALHWTLLSWDWFSQIEQNITEFQLDWIRERRPNKTFFNMSKWRHLIIKKVLGEHFPEPYCSELKSDYKKLNTWFIAQREKRELIIKQQNYTTGWQGR